MEIALSPANAGLLATTGLLFFIIDYFGDNTLLLSFSI